MPSEQPGLRACSTHPSGLGLARVGLQSSQKGHCSNTCTAYFSPGEGLPCLPGSQVCVLSQASSGGSSQTSLFLTSGARQAQGTQTRALSSYCQCTNTLPQHGDPGMGERHPARADRKTHRNRPRVRVFLKSESTLLILPYLCPTS